MFLRRSKIVPNVAKAKKPKKKEPEAAKAPPAPANAEQENVGDKEVPEHEAEITNQSQGCSVDGVRNEVGGVSSDSHVNDRINVPTEPILPLSRTLLSSQDESASSADEANKKTKSVNLPKFRKYKPRITVAANKNVHKPTTSSNHSQETTLHPNTAETSTNNASSTSNDAKNARAPK